MEKWKSVTACSCYWVYLSLCEVQGKLGCCMAHEKIEITMDWALAFAFIGAWAWRTMVRNCIPVHCITQGRSWS